jgi:hypothetical protein
MMTHRRTTVFLVVLCLCRASSVYAWEADSTHVGLTEQAAFASGLHARLSVQHGRALGWYAPLAVPPAHAPALYDKLERLLPSSGYVPDKRGQESALGWLLLGTVLEDVPEERGRNHFLDPVHGGGLSARDPRGWFARLGTRLWAWLSSTHLGPGVAASDWIRAPDNDLGVSRFHRELVLSATAPTLAARDEHLAFALLCAGAILHVLEDVGSPSRARDDLAEHLQSLTAGGVDHGSRFERLAALLFGRLGVPKPLAPVRRGRLADYFTSSDARGLADLTARSWYSRGTLPGPVTWTPKTPREEVLAQATRSQSFPFPVPTFDAQAAARAGGGRVENDEGACLANYAVVEGQIAWSISDDCATQQLYRILPLVGAHTTGLLDFLFRGTLAVKGSDQGAVVTVGGTGLGKGSLSLWIEDEKGQRQKLGASLDVKGGAPETVLASVTSAGLVSAARLVAVFQGTDESGEEVVATGDLALRP